MSRRLELDSYHGRELQRRVALEQQPKIPMSEDTSTTDSDPRNG